jgi:hypothetical protein
LQKKTSNESGFSLQSRAPYLKKQASFARIYVSVTIVKKRVGKKKEDRKNEKSLADFGGFDFKLV